MWKKLELKGMRFGKLTAYYNLSFKNKAGHSLWYCVCDCGGIRIGSAGDLKSGRVRSCGCLLKRAGNIHPQWTRVEVICSWCGKSFNKKPVEIKKTAHNFCNMICWGAYSASQRSGKNHPRYNGGPIKVNCAWCGAEKEVFPGIIKKRDNHFCDLTCRGKWYSFNKSGKNSPQWQGGISYEPYCQIWTDEEFKVYIFERDNYKCQNPDCSGISKRLVRHHIDYDKKNCSPDNVITVCNSCNSRANGNREWHTEYYNEIMEGIDG